MYKNIIFTIAILIHTIATSAHEPDFDTIARIIVKEAAKVQPGEVVLIRGSAESLEIFEALAAATMIAGGQPVPVLDLPAANETAMREAPLEYLRQEHTAELALLEALDVYIDATPGFNPVEFLSRNVPRERLIAARQGRASYMDAVNNSSHREVYIGQSSGVPTRSYADFVKTDFQEMHDIFWRAVAVTPDELKKVGSRVAEVMKPGAKIHLTGPNGTDLSFTLSDEPVTVTTGLVSEISSATGPVQAFLPAGELAACVDPSSANGMVYVPVYPFRADVIKGMTLTFKDGVLMDMSAESGSGPLHEFLKGLDGPPFALSLVNIGLNKESRVIPGSSYRSWEMGGVVTIFMGDNTIFQCSHVAGNRLHPHVEGLTLTANGHPVVREGVVQ